MLYWRLWVSLIPLTLIRVNYPNTSFFESLFSKNISIHNDTMEINDNIKRTNHFHFLVESEQGGLTMYTPPHPNDDQEFVGDRGVVEPEDEPSFLEENVAFNRPLFPIGGNSQGEDVWDNFAVGELVTITPAYFEKCNCAHFRHSFKFRSHIQRDSSHSTLRTNMYSDKW